MSIRKLPQHVINKISAGEVITRPLSVIKELIENSLDAGGEEIKIEYNNKSKTVSNTTGSAVNNTPMTNTAGNSFYSSLRPSVIVTDNGTGIKEEDFELLCARYCTSKLGDESKVPSFFLSDVNTYGFRGEALASISEVSVVEVETKMNGARHGEAPVNEKGYKSASVRECGSAGGSERAFSDERDDSHTTESHFPAKKSSPSSSQYGYALQYHKNILATKVKRAMTEGTKITISNLFSGNTLRRCLLGNNASEAVDVFRLVAGYQTVYEGRKFFLFLNGRELIYPFYFDRDLRNSSSNDDEVCINEKSMIGDTDAAHDNAITSQDTIGSSCADSPFTSADRFVSPLVLSPAQIKAKISILNSHFSLQNTLAHVYDEKGLIIFSQPVQKDLVLILSVNNRLTRSVRLKAKILSLYAGANAVRGSGSSNSSRSLFPLVFVQLNVKACDFNVDPMKQRILFEGEEEVYDDVVRKIKEKMESNCSVSISGVGAKSGSGAKNGTNAKNGSFPSDCFLRVYGDEKVESLKFYKFKKDESGLKKLERDNGDSPVKDIEEKTKNCEDIESEETNNEDIKGEKISDDPFNGKSFNEDRLKEKSVNPFSIDNASPSNIASTFVKNMKFIGKLNPEKVFIQVNAFLMLCDYPRLLQIYFNQRLEKIKELENESLIVIDNIRVDLDKEKGHDDNCVSNENRVGDENCSSNIDNSLAGCFVRKVKDYEIFFGILKRKVKETDEVRECFSIITGLNELYKVFKRT